MLGMTKEELLQVAAQNMQTNQDITTAIAAMIEANNKMLTEQIQPRNKRFDLM